MQPITFYPALGRRSKLKITPFPPDKSDGAHEEIIKFRATFDTHKSYVKARAEGIRVEVWTNIPFPGLPPGKWGALPFARVDSVQDQGQGVSTQTPSLHSEEEQNMCDERTVYLNLRAPLQVGSRFRFTYRLVYPSGHIQWLTGKSGDGILEVEQGLPGISLGTEWEMQDGRYRVNSCPSDGVLARVEHPDDWTIWVLEPSSYPARFTGTEPTSARALMLLPRPSSQHRQDLLTAKKPLVILAHDSSSLQYSPDGTVSSHHKDGQVTLGILDRSRDLLEQVMSICNGRLLAWDTASVVLASRLAHAVQPFHVLVLPIAPSGPSSVPLSVLQPLAAEMMSDDLALYSPQQRKARLLSTSGLQDSGDLLCSGSGEEVIVAPIHISRSSDKEWQVAFLAPCKEIAVTFETSSPSEPLPTPPLSPPHVSSTRNTNAAAGSSASSDATREESASPTSSSPGRPPRQRHRRTLSLSLIRNLPARLLRAYLHTIFNVIFWFWDVFVRALAVRLLGEGVPRRISSILGFALSVTASRHRTAQNTRSTQEPETPRLAPRSDPPGGARDHPSLTSAWTPDDRGLVASPQPQYPPQIHEEPVSAQATQRVVLTAALVPKHDMPFVIVRGPGAIKEVKAALNGAPLPSPSIVPLEDGAHLLMLEGVEQGGDCQLEVLFDVTST